MTKLEYAQPPLTKPMSDWLAKLIWPVVALALLLAYNLIVNPSFFRVQVLNGHLYGSLIDILNRGSPVMLLSLGMTLVIATGGVDLSVGAVMAIAGAAAAEMINRQTVGFPPLFHFVEIPVTFPLVIAVSLGVSLLAGMWNGALVAAFKIQPIVATLILMVAGRGIAQLITGGQYTSFTDAKLVYVGNGHFLGLPFPVTIVAVMFLITALLTRKTALGLFIESVGDNEKATYYAGISSRGVKFMAYTFTGFCAGLAGLIAASNIKCADSNHAGLFLELDAIVAVVVGGTALTGGRCYLLGSIIGALLMQTLTTTMYMADVSPYVMPVPKALVIVAVCLIQSPVFRGQIVRVVKWRPA